MWTNSSLGIGSKKPGSKLRSLFLFLLLAFLPSFLWPQELSSDQSQQTTRSQKYSSLTKDQLLKLIDDKDRLLSEWLMWHDKVMTSQAELAKASADQVATRDKLIADQKATIAALKAERDEALSELSKQKSKGVFENILSAISGAGIGFTAAKITN